MSKIALSTFGTLGTRQSLSSVVPCVRDVKYSNVTTSTMTAFFRGIEELIPQKYCFDHFVFTELLANTPHLLTTNFNQEQDRLLALNSVPGSSRIRERETYHLLGSSLVISKFGAIGQLGNKKKTRLGSCCRIRRISPDSVFGVILHAVLSLHPQ